jgi:hypothetical protein
MPGLTFRVLDCEITVTASSPDILGRVEDIAIRSEDREPARHALLFRADTADGGYRIRFEAQESPLLPDAVYAALYLHEWIYQRVLFCHEAEMCLHAGCFSLGGRLGIVSGEKGAGKTTMLCAMAAEGREVFSDEYLLIGDDTLAPVPRKFHLKEKTLELVPGLQQKCESLVSYPSHSGGGFFFHDPCVPWKRPTRTEEGIIFFIAPDHAGESRIEPCSPTEMAQLLLTQVIHLGGNPGMLIRRMCSLVARFSGYRVHFGTLDSFSNELSTVV